MLIYYIYTYKTPQIPVNSLNVWVFNAGYHVYTADSASAARPQAGHAAIFTADVPHGLKAVRGRNTWGGNAYNF